MNIDNLIFKKIYIIKTINPTMNFFAINIQMINQKDISRKHLLIDINIKNILCILISLKFNYISYQIEKNILFGLIKLIYMFVLI